MLYTSIMLLLLLLYLLLYIITMLSNHNDLYCSFVLSALKINTNLRIWALDKSLV